MEEMVEDIIFEVPETGDPEPKLKESDRRRLDSIVQKMIENGENDDAIGLVVNDFKSKYATKALVAPAKTKVEAKTESGREMASVFGGAKGQPVASVTGAAQGVMPKPTREMIKENKAIGELKNSKAKIIEEISGNDDVIEKLIRKSRLDNAAMEQPHPASDMPQTSSALSVQMLLPQEAKPHEQPVTPEEIAAFKMDTEQDEMMSRGFLDKVIENKPAKKKEIQKSVYMVDAMNRVAQSTDKEKVLDKVKVNSEKLSKGELIYNVKNGMLIKPEGVLGSLITGWQHKSKGYDDYSFLNNKSDQEIIEEYEKRRTEYDPDDPVPVPKHKVAEITQMAGSMPLKSIVAGGIVSAAGAPQAAPFVAGAVGAADFYRLGYANSFANVYNQLRDEGKTPEEALSMAKAQANKEAVIDAAVGGSMSIFGARIGMKPISFSQGYKSAIADFVKGAGKEGGIQGLIGAGGEVAKNKLAQAAGITREADANVLEAIESNFLMTAGFGAVAQLGRGIPKLKYRSILNGLKKVPENVMEANIQSELDAGRLTEQQATNIRNEVNAYKELDGQIPENVTEEARLEIQKKLEKRNELEGKLETLNKAFHPDIKEKIKVLDEEIAGLAKHTEKPPQDAPEIKEAKLLIDQSIEEGMLPKVFAAIAKENPEGFMKFVADQALGRDESGVVIKGSEAEGEMRRNLGDELVDKAMEMFPMDSVDKKVSLESLSGEKFEINLSDISLESDRNFAESLNQDGRAHFDIKASGRYLGYFDVVLKGDDVQIIGSGVLESGKGLGKHSYELLAKKLQEKGKSLISDTKRSDEGERLWRSLERDGKAKKENNYYRYILGDPLTIKTESDAIPIESAAEVPLRETSGDSGPVAEGVRPAEEPAGKETAGQEGAATGAQQPEMIGITHAQMDNVARELGLPEYSQDPETFAQWDEQARDRFVKDPDAINKLITKLRNGEGPDKIETRMMIMHMADLKARYNKNPTPELLAEIARTKDLYNISGREKGKELVARKGAIPVEETLADFHMTDTDFNRGAVLTEQQLAQSTKEFQEISAAKTALEEKVAKLEAAQAKAKAEEYVKKEKSTAKKSEKKDYKAERTQIIADIKEKLRKSRGETSATILPYAKELIAIAPDVAKLVRNLVEEGIDKLPDIVKSVHDQIREFIPEATEKDVHDIIAGEYTPKKKRSEVAEKLFDLRVQAKLINKLEALEAGMPPKSEKARVRRNIDIEELRKKIKALQGDTKTDDQKLAAIKSRTKSEIAKLEDQLKKGDFAKEEKEPVKLDKEGQELRDKLLKLREERDIRLMKQDYDNTRGFEKITREANQYLNISRQIKSTGDVSMPFRQALVGVADKLFSLPFKMEDGKLKFTNFEAQKRLTKTFGEMYTSLAKESTFRRIMADIKESRFYEIAKEAGLEISDPNSPLAEAREEFMYPSKLEKVPGVKNVVKASNRAATAFVNVMKWNKFVEFANMFEQQGMSMKNSPDAYKQAAIYANQTVGRGHLGPKLEMANWLTSRMFFSLRLQASRLQLMTKFLNPKFYTKVPKEVRIEYLKDMTKTLMLGMGVLATANAAGVDVELDPRSSEFGKVRVGDTVFDIWGGFQQYAVLFARILSGATKSTKTGKITELGNEKFGQKNEGDVLLRFLRTKASPELGTAINLLTGQRIDYKPVTLGGEALDFISPIMFGDISDAYKDGGVQRALITALLAGHGVGVITYDDEEKKDDGKRNKRAKRAKRPQRESRN